MLREKSRVKVIVSKKSGFTLVELLATIALLSILIVFVVPKIYSYIETGTNKALQIQEKNVEDSAKIFLEDYCKSPINSAYANQCAILLNKEITASGFATFEGTLKLSFLIDKKYIDPVTFKKNSCDSTSYIEFNTDDTIKAYLKCGEIKTSDWDQEKLNDAKPNDV